MEAYQHLHEFVLEGCYTFNKGPWEFLGHFPEANRIFNEAMAIDTSVVMDCVTKMYEYGFKSINTRKPHGKMTAFSLLEVD